MEGIRGGEEGKEKFSVDVAAHKVLSDLYIRTYGSC